ncbi:hypothetical protein [Nocardia jejuensis]|uniref:hypothetical protein n=1 Tax=Nocardia jejuensis TaxID=328049 RepID=UPI000830F380|nr:hypothetical protein [Nocardia jejuensis]
MSKAEGVTVTDTVQWLHDEGLARLALISRTAPSPIVAFTVEVATGTVTAFPVVVTGPGTDVLTLPADDLPPPSDSPKRLVIIGLTATDSVLVLDFAAIPAFVLRAERPETTARAWVAQLLLDPEVTIITNSPHLAVPAGIRCRHTFIPGGGTLLTVDDKRPPVTTITLNSADNATDQLDVAEDGSAELYLGNRFWQLRHVLSIDDPTWATLITQVEPSE